MNKKAGLGMEILNVFIAAGIISTLFFIFYAYYGISEHALAFKLTEKTMSMKENYALISLLNTPVDNKLTIADLIALERKNEAASSIRSTISKIYGPGLKYTFAVDDDIIAETDSTPSAPVTQEIVLPKINHKTSKIIFEFGK